MSVATHVLKAGEVARVSGPARIEVVDGEILLVGNIYGRGSNLVVHELRSYSLKALVETTLRVSLGSGGFFGVVDPSTEVIDDWLRVAEVISEDFNLVRKLKVVVVGPPESGKTTLTAFIANYLRGRGLNCCIIEGDVGQEDLATPATIALAVVDKPFIWQRELSFSEFRFVGCISPRNCSSRIIASTVDLVNQALFRGCDAVIVNTDGWVSGRDGVSYKLELIRWVKPTHLVVLDSNLSDLMVKVFREMIKIIRAKPPIQPRIRSREERQRLRSEAYKKYFMNSSVKTLRASKVGLIGMSPLNCVEIPASKLAEMFPELSSIATHIIRACRDEKELALLIKSPPHVGLLETLRNEIYLKYSIKLFVFSVEDLVRCLVGVVGDNMNEVAAGIIEDVRFEEDDILIKLRTPHEGLIKGLISSNIRLDEEYREVRRGE
ncbi:MAG: Clp1/GlmU family protein [Zestosphaera sp.]